MDFMYWICNGCLYVLCFVIALSGANMATERGEWGRGELSIASNNPLSLVGIAFIH